ncbi:MULTISPECIES: hypothetical protein [Bradyrhizobium]|uniref:hypothetical protein n=1 Tax=Bradyrhizobium TaxID=374 RepID=UPI001EDAAF81|nr:hypothetical protein [Bradyrhizobium zhengyangense]MCG2643810.1 hypothetical protein [Bradyrhizobium zhengyangense]
MRVAMTDAERLLFTSFANCSQRYLEFGSGGSTWIAASTPKEWLITVDSSQEWLAKVSEETKDSPTQPRTQFVDIGPLGEWGAPTDVSTRDRWPQYHEAVWQIAESIVADFYFVDGRFRIACMMQCFLRCRQDAFIAIHDFQRREYYHIVREFGREIAMTENLSVFVRSVDFDARRANDVLKKHWLDTA